MRLLQHKLLKPVVGAGLTVCCGLLLWGTKPGEFLVNASYDYLFLFNEKQVPNQVVLIQMDNHSYEQFGQMRTRPPWDRSIHADLLRQLAKDGCSLVVFDVVFEFAGDSTKDRALLSALRELNRVVLAADLDDSVGKYNKARVANYESAHVVKPLDEFLDAAGTNYGIARLDERDSDFIVRRHWPFREAGERRSLAWSAAGLAGARLDSQPQEQWLRYYGEHGCWAILNYVQATNQATGYFKDKIVFIGNEPEDPNPEMPEKDKFRTPYIHWTYPEAVGGVEIQIAEFLNLLHGDWLRRPAGWVEFGVFLMTGILLGVGLCNQPGLRGLALAGGIAVLISLAGVSLSRYSNYWFPWLVVAAGQTSCALAWSLLGPVFLKPESEIPDVPSESPAEQDETPLHVAGSAELPDSDDYEILHLLGEGSFGKVWLARNAVGQWQALKVVYQSKFGSNPKPYEREFNGIRRYKPISDKHPGLLRIDFVSKKKKQGYFYYVMELGDALEPGWEKEPGSYKPKDLFKLLGLTEHRRLPARECLRVAIHLAEALDFLHRQSLTHGDVKPQNIIFVNGQPKLADVGLVKEVTGTTQTQTGACTLAYMDPAGVPGTPQADLYALGIVLYVMFMGREPESFPGIATTLVSGAGSAEFVRINALIVRACHTEISRRYASAREMAEALKEVQAALGP